MEVNRNLIDLFDLEWYSKEANTNFGSKKEAIQHYLEKGEALGCFPNPLFDPTFYRDRYHIRNANSFVDFCDQGIKKNRDPNPLFLSKWYKWQNPTSEAYLHPLFHYLTIGDSLYIDPSPMVDMGMVRKTLDENLGGVALLNLIIKGEYTSYAGITKSFNQLVSKQRKFIKKCKFNIHKKKPVNARKKYLLWVQCRLGTEFFNWYQNGERNWDLLLNFYDNSSDRSFIGDYVLSQQGTKFTAIFNIWRQTDILDTYEYLLFIDDDLIFRYQDIDEYFNIISKINIDLSQPSLSKGSYCVWPVFFNSGRKGVRWTNGVEIMMPAFSKRSFNIMAPYFGTSVSGFGLDLLFAKLAKNNNFSVAVVDAVKASHFSEIDQSSGAYYEMLRSNGINSKYELWALIKRYNLEMDFYEA